jgi:hypothetical protein
LQDFATTALLNSSVENIWSDWAKTPSSSGAPEISATAAAAGSKAAAAGSSAKAQSASNNAQSSAQQQQSCSLITSRYVRTHIPM